MSEDYLAEMRSLVLAKGPQCRLCLLMADMPEEHREAVRAGLADPRVTDAALGKWIEMKGYEWPNGGDPRNTISNHRSRGHGA